MAVNVQFSIAVHIMVGLACACDDGLTSSRLAASVNTSPSFIRRTLAKLSKAGLADNTTGKSGSCRLGKDARKITLLDIYRAVDAPRAIAIHSYTEQKGCPVSCQIKATLEKALAKSQKAMEASLAEVNLAQIVSDVKR